MVTSLNATPGQKPRPSFAPTLIAVKATPAVSKLEAAVRTHWQLWLDDEIDLPTALDRLADAFPKDG